MPLSLRTLSVVLLAGFLFAILLTQGSAEPPASEPPASEPISGKPISGKPISGKPISGKPISGESTSDESGRPSERLEETDVPASGEALMPSMSQIPTPTPLSDAQQQRILGVIEDAFNGKFPPGGSGDPILDDVLGGLKERKPLSQQLGVDLFQEDVATSRLGRPERINHKANAAEAILRAARLLEGVEESSPERDDLITEMRAEAKRLL